MTLGLANFIRCNIECISSEWEKFAATLLPDEEFSASVLQDGIADILREIAADMDHSQSAEEQQGKSEGDQRSRSEKDNAAETHALARVRMGLSSRQLISEFRALRATVIRLWQQSDPVVGKREAYDITRFNEAIDQALTEAAVRHSEKIEESRELFLGILGHDLRNPLAAISGAAKLQLRTMDSDRSAMLSNQILISIGRMSCMITDLLELTRVQLGTGISINPSDTDMGEICSHALEEMMAIYPSRRFQLQAEGNLLGQWDQPRLKQVLSNLLGNAVQHGNPGSTITVVARKKEAGVELQIHNEGAEVPPEMMQGLFDRFIQGKAGKITEGVHSTSLGLGLYIAKEIVVAHGGTITAHSTAKEGTTFTAFLPQ
jgi:signal transduction histidine kinase